MKTFEQCCDEYAQKEFGYKNWWAIPKDARPYHFERAAKCYAREAIAEHLERAADEAKLKHLPGQYGAFVNVDRDSIRNIEIILK